MTIPSINGSPNKLLALAALVLTCAMPATAPAQAAGVEPEATRILRRMTDYMAGSAALQLRYARTRSKRCWCPARRSSSTSPPRSRCNGRTGCAPNAAATSSVRSFYYDGKTLTLYNPAEKLLRDACRSGHDRRDARLRARLARCRRARQATFCTQDALREADPGRDLGIRGRQGRHRRRQVRSARLQRAGGRLADLDRRTATQPLPRKYVITTKDLAGWPQFTVVARNWNLAPDVNDSLFNFAPPPGAQKIEFLQLSHTGANR